MKLLSEYRDPVLVGRILARIGERVTRPWRIMEVCGGQTHNLVKYGILSLLPKEITLVHGPGCPVCVTSLRLVDQAVELAERGVALCSYGDMLRVPGSRKSLREAKASGADVRMVYSPLEAVRMARENPAKEFVFFAIGFETTAPANGLAVVHAAREGLRNFSLLSAHVLVPPAMEALLADPDCRIDGFLAAGHVCTVMGYEEYEELAARHRVPIVVTGFEPLDLLEGILELVVLLEEGRATAQNAYRRVVRREGNPEARALLARVFARVDREWRGIGTIPGSGLDLRPEWKAFDARLKFALDSGGRGAASGCRAGLILKGILKPHQCPLFGKECTPITPKGAPMVSSEGACAAYYHFAGIGSGEGAGSAGGGQT
ncbi:Hydrogenase expression/formation protein HypD [Methylacidimicrobium sp. AP8]|uniref:hydrogenase formation protein HypD n=1 Tax=Methylacidimicrobium sp. AP8 TaxID=2730359 RepID=UPI0018C1585F|nr:hydrogenase formation protein HypD [Methylacidimicrobium sp. AP8]CAB4243703.1 Hydrogenase expression/formation protein HypD [Methylacidimicrobium sp. AP8]